jgi:hypothetical protein
MVAKGRPCKVRWNERWGDDEERAKAGPSCCSSSRRLARAPQKARATPPSNAPARLASRSVSLACSIRRATLVRSSRCTRARGARVKTEPLFAPPPLSLSPAHAGPTAANRNPPPSSTQVVDVSTSKTGKHGHAKCNFTCIDIFTGKKYEEMTPSSHNMDVSVVDTCSSPRESFLRDGARPARNGHPPGTTAPAENRASRTHNTLNTHPHTQQQQRRTNRSLTSRASSTPWSTSTTKASARSCWRTATRART